LRYAHEEKFWENSYKTLFEVTHVLEKGKKMLSGKYEEHRVQIETLFNQNVQLKYLYQQK